MVFHRSSARTSVLMACRYWPMRRLPAAMPRLTRARSSCVRSPCLLATMVRQMAKFSLKNLTALA